jgi:hypothetical protein
MRWSWFWVSFVVLGCNSDPSPPSTPGSVLESSSDNERGSETDPYGSLPGEGDGQRPEPTVLDAGPAADPYH